MDSTLKRIARDLGWNSRTARPLIEGYPDIQYLIRTMPNRDTWYIFPASDYLGWVLRCDTKWGRNSGKPPKFYRSTFKSFEDANTKFLALAASKRSKADQ